MNLMVLSKFRFWMQKPLNFFVANHQFLLSFVDYYFDIGGNCVPFVNHMLWHFFDYDGTSTIIHR